MLEKYYQPGDAEVRHYKRWDENGEFEIVYVDYK